MGNGLTGIMIYGSLKKERLCFNDGTLWSGYPKDYNSKVSLDNLENVRKLISYADEHMNDNVKIDYFAVSLPDFLVFDEDLNRKNKIHCLFMKALGLQGKGEKEAEEILKKVFSLDNSHFAANVYSKIAVPPNSNSLN